MATFSPTSRFNSVDLPTLGRPISATKPDLKGRCVMSGRAGWRRLGPSAEPIVASGAQRCAHGADARWRVEESVEESRRWGTTTDTRENVARTLVHTTSRSRIVIVVSNEMQQSVHEEKIQFQREADVLARRLPRGGVGRNDDLAEQTRWPGSLQIEGQYIGRAPHAEIPLVESADLASPTTVT